MNIGVFNGKIYFTLTLLYGLICFLTLFTKHKNCDKISTVKQIFFGDVYGTFKNDVQTQIFC